MLKKLPEQKHVYQNHMLNGGIWDQLRVRPDDIIVVTSQKSGTTWMQAIVLNLIFQNREIPAPVWELSLWLERKQAQPKETLRTLEAQQHRRCIKTHLPLNGMPYFSQAKYVYVGRDGRDIFMSLWNHHRHLTPEIMRAYNATLSSQGKYLPPCPDDIHEFYRDWISKSWFPWEQEGYPYWSALHHLDSWWQYRHLPNILFVHFNDLLKDLESEIRRIAEFLELPFDEPLWAERLDELTFTRMKSNAEQYAPSSGGFLQGGARRFLYQGTNGRWRGVLDQDELHRYDRALARQLDPECQVWLECGRCGVSS